MSEPENRDQAEGRKYPRIIKFAHETPWAILEDKLHDIRAILALHSRGEKLTSEEIEARIGNGPARRDAYTTDGSTAVIPIHGVITPRADLMTDISGGTSIDRLQASLRQAVADPKVKTVVLDVNSPGGSVAMLNEMAQEIRQARRSKPVVAVANTMAASAAYQLASQATEFFVTPSGSVGSIGTIAMHEDVSSALEDAGVKVTSITAGKFKGELSPFAPLSEEAKAQMQSQVDKYYAMFVQDVARGRGVSVDTVRQDFGQGRMLLAKDALAAGMVDGIASLDTVLARIEKQGAPSAAERNEDEGADVGIDAPAAPPGSDTEPSTEAAASGLSFADEADAAIETVEALTYRARSLAEFRDRGRLGPSKRGRLTACTEAMRESLTALEQLIEATTPIDHQAAMLAERARFERSIFEGART